MISKYFYNAIFFIFLILVSLTSFGSNIDSLKIVFGRASNPLDKIDLAFAISLAYRHSAPDSAGKYAGIMLKDAKSAGNDSMAMEAETDLGCLADDADKIPESINYFTDGLEIARKKKYEERELFYLTYRADEYGKLGKSTLQIADCEAAAPLAEKIKNYEREAVAYDIMSDGYTRLGNFNTAFDVLTKSIAINYRLKNSTNLGSNYTRAAILFAQQEKYQEALKYTNMADSIYVVLNDTGQIVGNNIYKIMIYSYMGKYAEAVSMYRALLKRTNDPKFLNYIYDYMGIALNKSKEYRQALGCFIIADSLTKRLPNYADPGDIHLGMAHAYFHLQQFDSALKYAKLNENKFKRADFGSDDYNENVQLLASIYVAKNDIKNADLYYKESLALQDSTISKLKSDNQSRAEAGFHLEEKNKQLSALVDENELQKLKAQKQAIITTTLVVSTILGICIIAGIIIAYRRTLKRNHLLLQQKAVLSEQKKTIDEQMVALAGVATMKSQFMANISHELRTPATLLSGMLELMNDSGIAKKESDQVRMDIAYRNSKKLQQMIEEILDLSKLDYVEGSYKCQVLKVSPLIQRIITAFDGIIEKESLTLEYIDNNPGTASVKTDENRFEKIISNLIYNAIKFNRQNGWIKVVKAISSDKKNVIISVSDSGTGISKEDLPHIFERFYQGNSSYNAKATGAGIGLALVYEFTGSLGGTVAADSIEGVGTTFTLQFPIVEDDQNEIEGDTLAEVVNWQQFAEKPVVLVVEDNAEMIYYIREVLNGIVTVATAANGLQALQWLTANKADLIITDMMMPVMDGKEFFASLKVSDTLSKLPVIMLTALADTGHISDMLRMGIDDHIVKPFNASELKVRIYNLLSNYLERIQFISESSEPGDALIADGKEAEAFKSKLTKYVTEKIGNIHLSVSDIAQEMGYSERQLYRFSKILTGFTPAQLIKEIKLMKAYDLLNEGKVYKIDDLARRVGYEHTSYFSKQFLERFGKRPTEYL